MQKSSITLELSKRYWRFSVMHEGNYIVIDLSKEDSKSEPLINEHEVVEKIKEMYLVNDVCLSEFLDSITVTGMSINMLVSVYAKLFETIERDKVLRVTEEGDEFKL